MENGLPLTDVGLIALLDIRLPPKMLLVLVGDFVARATDLSRFVRFYLALLVWIHVASFIDLTNVIYKYNNIVCGQSGRQEP